MEMGMNQHKVLAIRALNSLRSEEAARVGWAMRKITAKEMDQKPIGCVLTHRQLLDYYHSLDEPIDAAIAWIESFPD